MRPISTPVLRHASIACAVVGAGALVVGDGLASVGEARVVLAVSVGALVAAVVCGVVLARRARHQ
jgi:hypothetical protein